LHYRCCRGPSQLPERLQRPSRFAGDRRHLQPLNPRPGLECAPSGTDRSMPDGGTPTRRPALAVKPTCSDVLAFPRLDRSPLSLALSWPTTEAPEHADNTIDRLESGSGMRLGNVAPRHSDFECHARFACGASGAMKRARRLPGSEYSASPMLRAVLEAARLSCCASDRSCRAMRAASGRSWAMVSMATW
jgi:hypothetical protein